MESTKLLIENKRKSTKKATKLVIAVKTLKYEERLKYLNLPTLKYRRLRRDMIDAYKIFTGKYDTTVTSWLTGKHVESKYNLRNHIDLVYTSCPYILICVSSDLQTELLLCGIVDPIQWFQLIR